MRRFIITGMFAAALTALGGCQSDEPMSDREEAEVAQEDLEDAREEAADVIAEAEEESVEVLSEAQGEAKQMVQEAKQTYERELEDLRQPPEVDVEPLPEESVPVERTPTELNEAQGDAGDPSPEDDVLSDGDANLQTPNVDAAGTTQ